MATIECTDKEAAILVAKLASMRMTSGERTAVAVAKAAEIRAWQESHWTPAQVAERDRRNALAPNARLVEDLLKQEAKIGERLMDPALAEEVARQVEAAALKES